MKENRNDYVTERDEFSFGNRDGEHDGGDEKMHEPTTKAGRATAMPPTSVMTRLILIMVWRKLIRNPNTYSSLIGLTWSLVSFKYKFSLPSANYLAQIEIVSLDSFNV